MQPDQRGPNEIWIVSTGYEPPTLTITAGTQVTWTNKDNVTHDATSGSPGNVESKFPPTKNLKPNQTSDPVLFSNKGTFKYFCLIHGSGHGTGVIIVQ